METKLPLLPLKGGIVLFPGAEVPLFVDTTWTKMLEICAGDYDSKIVLVTKKDPEGEISSVLDLHSRGVACEIYQVLKYDEKVLRLLVKPYHIIDPINVTRDDKGIQVLDFAIIEEEMPQDPATLASLEDIIKSFKEIVQGSGSSILIPPVVIDQIEAIGRTEVAFWIISWHTPGSTKQKMALLESPWEKKIEILQELLKVAKISVDIEREIEVEVNKDIQGMQREHVLRAKISKLQELLGDKEGGSLSSTLQKRLDESKMPDEHKKKLQKELDRLATIPEHSPEVTVISSYVGSVLDLPWGISSEDRLDIPLAQEVMERDFYGLEKIKDRILDFLAVRKMIKTPKGQILCFIGPPGTGKSSICKSIAESMNRKYARISLGGMRDEAEIRGHRRTYIGSTHGRILQRLKDVAVDNPVFVLDEIDKIGADWRGDPSSALLEVLDPEQNSTFSDNYVDIPFDLSKVFFICTGNNPGAIPIALRDRMEIIYFSGYTDREKLHIAEGHLVPKQLLEHGLKDNQVSISSSIILELVSKFTREGGVRELERVIATVMRKTTRKASESEDPEKYEYGEVKVEHLYKMLGTAPYDYTMKKNEDQIGVVQALSWSPTGGDILPIEVAVMEDDLAKLTCTGNLGKTMKESAMAALTYVKSNAESLGIEKVPIAEIHVHATSAGIPKDGPSAGVTISIGIISALRKVPVRCDIAMTGEISLRGDVLKIGGVKEKVLAAYRAGIKEVILPKDNIADMDEVPEEVKDKMQFHFVKSVSEIIPLALRE